MASALHSVRVDLQSGSYDIVVQAGLLASIGERLRALTNTKRVSILTDSHLAAKHLEPLRRSLTSAGIDSTVATIPAGEDHKNLQTLLPVYEQFLAAKIERSTPLLAFGGGVVGDMGGFVAATLLRGVPFVQVPTSLLAMVDASVGGKTGVNTPQGKNLVGAFHQPIAVLIDPQVLTTLPPRELRGGLAECIKHDIIRDADGFNALERHLPEVLKLDIERLAELVAHNVRIKARVVEADPFEKGERAHLNFGHTFGHAIENVSNYSYSHGECVALGMCAASHLATKLGMLDMASHERIVKLTAAAGLPTSGLKLDTDAVVDAMAFDKKVQSGSIRFILPDRIGHVVIRDDIPRELVRDAVQSLKS